MFDIILECIRAAILLYLLVYLIKATRNQTDIPRKGWNFILTGFSLLLFANVMDIIDNFESLNKFIAIGDTPTQAFLEKIIGYSAGFLLVTIGLLKWLPTITTRNKLQESERKFRLAFEISGIGMVMVDLKRKLLKVNKTFCEITGYTETELLKMDIIDITHPDDITISNKLIENLVSGRKTHDTIEKRYIHKDGSTIWTIISVSIVSDENGKQMYFVSQINDITSRKKVENATQKSKDDLNAIFYAAPVGMLLINSNLTVKQVNDVATKLVGKQAELLVGTQPGHALGCIHANDDPLGCGYGLVCPGCPLRNTVTKVMETGVQSLENEIQASLKINGTNINAWLKVCVSPVQIDDERHVIVTVSNITDRKETEEQLIIEKDRADKMAAEAQEANKAKSQFLASMSHEIRTPMNSIIGFSDILAEEVSSKDHKEYVEIIQNSGKHLLHLINDILDYSKIEAGKMDIDISFSSLKNTFDNVEAMMRPFAEAKGLRFEFTKSTDVPEKIRTDPARVEQCLINLVNNAIKFTDEGHVKVRSSMESIDGNEFVCIDVEDTGIGISPKLQQDIFDSFTQGEQGSAKKQAGTGLGLAITKQLTELLGGTIRLKSEPSQGSTFSIVIPIGMRRKVERTGNDVQPAANIKKLHHQETSSN